MADKDHLAVGSGEAVTVSEAKRARCFDADWKYTPHGSTDIRKLFAKVRRQQKEEAAKAEVQAVNVKPIRRKA
jgi:hypothetical protein